MKIELTEEQVAARREKKRARDARYRAANREKKRARDARYYLEHRERIRARNAKYYLEHKKESRARGYAWRAANRDKSREISKRYCDSHREQLRKRCAAYYAANKEECRARCRKYEAEHKDKMLAVRRSWYRRDTRRVDPNAPKVENSCETRTYSKNRQSVNRRHYEWRKRMRAFGVPEERIPGMIMRMEKAHDNKRRYLRYWSSIRKSTDSCKARYKAEERARLAMALGG